ncbi:CHAP domain-containing protein [Novosphingobium mangrovi (ex Huang et al. 2023)]|uniref:CHAP domain-containing protein n=1 Tax=Novosphingobium mangrovi (ex Huang et al. 2023) TaxID=2976432 RepID=A0ABT2I4K4_9SPHN|nr:CHAP domain-containing protein [Novosphingobium mangrovi (ex Huang et al. 2023)]MCT2399750.1 CHAP domain-containing protein [Novosphingobium mangrovi (ex Huang et al. 2023)]
MKGLKNAIFLGACAIAISPATASSAIDRIISGDEGTSSRTVSGSSQTSGLLQCVPYARQLSGIQIYGDAHTWWKQAKGQYARGHTPRVGAVMAIRPHGNSHLGHVATVSKIVDSRTILLSHANWSYPGKIERNVAALDVSPENDWSEVRIWYAPSNNLGVSHWPVAGFIYNARPGTVPDLGSERLAQVAEHSEAKSGRKRRHGDPIGEIIAGTY